MRSFSIIYSKDQQYFSPTRKTPKCCHAQSEIKFYAAELTERHSLYLRVKRPVLEAQGHPPDAESGRPPGPERQPAGPNTPLLKRLLGCGECAGRGRGEAASRVSPLECTPTPRPACEPS